MHSNLLCVIPKKKCKSLVLRISYQKLVEIVRGSHWVLWGAGWPSRGLEIEATAVVLHLDPELEVGFAMDPKEPGTLTSLLLWARVGATTAAQLTGGRCPWSQELSFRWTENSSCQTATSSSGLEFLLLLLFQEKATIAFLKAECLPPSWVPDFFFPFPGCFSTKLNCSGRDTIEINC